MYLWPVVVVIDGGLDAVRQMQVGEPERSDLDAVGFQLRDDLVGQEQALTPGYGSVMSGTGSHMSDHPQSRTSEPETLRYRVPDPQDPVVVLSALADAGVTAVPSTPDRRTVFVSMTGILGLCGVVLFGIGLVEVWGGIWSALGFVASVAVVAVSGFDLAPSRPGSTGGQYR